MNSLKDLNHDRSVHGIIIQLPIPKHLDEQVGSSINLSISSFIDRPDSICFRKKSKQEVI